MEISSEWRIKQTISNEVTIFRIYTMYVLQPTIYIFVTMQFENVVILFLLCFLIYLFVVHFLNADDQKTTAGEQCSNGPQGTWSVKCTDHSCRIPSNRNWAQQHMDLNIYLFNLIAWRRLAVLSRNIAIHWVRSDHIMGETIIFLFWSYLSSW